MKFKSGLEITDQQEANLRRLAYWHLSGAIYACPVGFEMRDFCSDGKQQVFPDRHECGTSACLIGHGPAAGIATNGEVSWWGYCKRCFIHFETPEWEWCFSGGWCDTDDTPEGGAKRILWLLENDLPDDWELQMSCKSPLCYADWEPEIPEEWRTELERSEA